MKIISFDVGIKNMAYCIFLLEENEKTQPFKVLDWNVVSLLEKEEPHVYCNSHSIKEKPKKKTKNTQKIENFFIDKCEEITPPKLCCRVGKFKKGNNVYCEKHSKTQTEWLLPDSRFSQKSLKKTKMDELIKLCLEMKIENKGKKRADLLKSIEEVVSLRYLEPVIERKNKTATETDLVSIGKKLKETFDKVLENHKDITHVLIENQISPLANRMKTIQGMLSQYFIMIFENISIEFISSANKLKIFSKENEPQTEEKTQSQIYKGHKKDGVYYSNKVLEKNTWITKMSLETKKKDDLADCFLQGLWYLLKIEKVKINENSSFEIIAK